MAKGTLKISGADAFVAADLAPDSVGTSEIAALAVDTAELAADAVDGTKIADNAVDSEHIAADSLDAEHYAPGSVDGTAIAALAVDTAELAADAVDGTKIADNAVDSEHIAADSIDAEHYAAGSVDTTAMAASVIGVKPHIIPDVLYPSSGNDLAGDALVATTDGPNGSTVASSKYGTVQASDGRMYYYTDIKGSKPIKDPRIGAHFGSQRHKGKSIQLLEQETATHGTNVYSIDGREWWRVVSGDVAQIFNNSHGHRPQFDMLTSDFVEITGYFNQATWSSYCNTHGTRYFTSTVVNGGTAHTTDTSHVTTVSTPLHSRYVDAGSVVKVEMETITSPQITTLRLNPVSSGYIELYAIELIAQDTSNVNNIQIPSQNVVSYGKKFTVSGTPHYDPFNGFVNDTTLFASVVDMDTSLGLGTATTWGAAWDTGSSDHIRPFNGGRVVKWVDSSGTIKTSVNMMPRNAQNIGNNNLNGSAGTASNEITTVDSTNSHTINFSNDVLNTSLSEVAKTFHHREFGNGGANGNTSYRDATVSLSDSNMAYVMDDGLTSLSGLQVTSTSTSFYPGGTDKYWYLTFIGTGISVTGINGTANLAMNLPYGTHILKYTRAGTTTSSPWVLDGIEIRQSWGSGSNESHAQQFTIHQPKMPPIPEDAVVLADYMLMADFIPIASSETTNISKGARVVHLSRDVFVDRNSGSSTMELTSGFETPSGFDLSGNDIKVRLPMFATNYAQRGYQSDTRTKLFRDASTDLDSSATKDNTASYGSYAHLTSDLTLGLHNLGWNGHASNKNGNSNRVEIATPIHTSSHYQTFETPFLHELVGGDRNMEQTNLVVTPDGKTWDEVTRDVSYIGDTALQIMSDNADEVDTGTVVIMDECRGYGTDTKKINQFNKDFAIAYDRQICLRDGEYEFHLGSIVTTAGSQAQVDFKVNGNDVAKGYTSNAGWSHAHMSGIIHLKRGDYVQVFGGYWGNEDNHHAEYYIRRLK